MASFCLSSQVHLRQTRLHHWTSRRLSLGASTENTHTLSEPAQRELTHGDWGALLVGSVNVLCSHLAAVWESITVTDWGYSSNRCSALPSLSCHIIMCSAAQIGCHTPCQCNFCSSCTLPLWCQTNGQRGGRVAAADEKRLIDMSDWPPWQTSAQMMNDANTGVLYVCVMNAWGQLASHTEVTIKKKTLLLKLDHCRQQKDP